MKDDIIEIANAYMEEHDGELPLLIVAKNDKEQRIIRCHLRDKHSDADQATFINVMRLAMIVNNYTEYSFVMKPEFDYQALQMTMHVWAVGEVTPEKKTSEFFVIEDEKLVPYLPDMPIGGKVAQIMPSQEERERQLHPNVIKQIKLYVENSTYVVPQKVDTITEAISGLDALFAHYEATNV